LRSLPLKNPGYCACIIVGVGPRHANQHACTSLDTTGFGTGFGSGFCFGPDFHFSLGITTAVDLCTTAGQPILKDDPPGATTGAGADPTRTTCDVIITTSSTADDTTAIVAVVAVATMAAMAAIVSFVSAVVVVATAVAVAVGRACELDKGMRVFRIPFVAAATASCRASSSCSGVVRGGGPCHGAGVRRWGAHSVRVEQLVEGQLAQKVQLMLDDSVVGTTAVTVNIVTATATIAVAVALWNRV
jgi:hypothetical protein